MSEVERKCRLAREASVQMKYASTEVKNKVLRAVAKELKANTDTILAANKKDLEAAANLPISLRKRLELDREKIKAMAAGFLAVSKLPDPVGEVVEKWKLKNGLKVSRVRVPLGVIAFIYESRPNVTAEAASIVLKSGNAIVLRGGSEAVHSNVAIANVVRSACEEKRLPREAVQMIESADRESAAELMRMREYIDVLIPRGGAGLIRAAIENARVPIIETGAGNCHIYVDKSADLKMAENIIMNAKLSSPYVCNAVEHVLVHEKIAPKFIPRLYEKMTEAGVEFRGCDRTRMFIKGASAMSPEELSTEYLDLIIGVKLVGDTRQAIDHINRYSTHHSDAIITKSKKDAKLFTERVDSCCVYVNASTRFTDGYAFGLGGEVGISTQRLHARGPLGLRELTTTKMIIEGKGQIRK